MDSKATVVWQGSLKQGEGKITTESKALNQSVYTFGTRFEDNPGTNPEELIAAAHAGCFTMAVADGLGDEDITPEKLETVATVTLSTEGNEPEVTQVQLKITGKLPGADEETFKKVANTAKENCPISRLLKADIALEVQLEK